MRYDMARAAAKVFFGGNAIYHDLKPGALFRFPTNARGTLYVKLKGGWYTEYVALLDPPKRKFKTGAGTAVIRAD